MIRRLRILLLATLLASGIFFISNHLRVDAATQRERAALDTHDRALLRMGRSVGQRALDRRSPGPAIEPYVRPEFAAEMRDLRATIIAAAERHNRPEQSGMSDHDFAVLIALIMYNEHFGWFEERVTPVQALTPFYESLQRETNEAGLSNLSVWPANLRPSVAAEILRGQVPLPLSGAMWGVPVHVTGTAIRPSDYRSERALYAAITVEITDPQLAVEYLAANLERGVYRARWEGVPPTWRALAAWHNQGIVAPEDIRANPTASDYVRRASAYFGRARALIDTTAPRVPGAKLASLER